MGDVIRSMALTSPAVGFPSSGHGLRDSSAADRQQAVTVQP